PWLGPATEEADTYSGPRALPGQVLFYMNSKEGENWVPRGTPGALSRVFIPARLSDNPYLTEDSTYAQQLMGLDPVLYAQLGEGNWLIRPAAGLYFKREWFETVEAVPSGARFVRYWDLAGTEEQEQGKKKNDPDWTVGV